MQWCSLLRTQIPQTPQCQDLGGETASQDAQKCHLFPTCCVGIIKNLVEVSTSHSPIKFPTTLIKTSVPTATCTNQARHALKPKYNYRYYSRFVFITYTTGCLEKFDSCEMKSCKYCLSSVKLQTLTSLFESLYIFISQERPSSFLNNL